MRRTVGRLLAALKLLSYLRQTGNVHEIMRVERCFAPDWSYVRKPKELDRILREYRQSVFPRPTS
jgi:hypothetical protein